jgi:hypothetical protein
MSEWLEGQWSAEYQAVSMFGRLLMTSSNIGAWRSLITVTKRSHGIWLLSWLVTPGVVVIVTVTATYTIHVSRFKKYSLTCLLPFAYTDLKWIYQVISYWSVYVMERASVPNVSYTVCEKYHMESCSNQKSVKQIKIYLRIFQVSSSAVVKTIKRYDELCHENRHRKGWPRCYLCCRG